MHAQLPTPRTKQTLRTHNESSTSTAAAAAAAAATARRDGGVLLIMLLSLWCSARIYWLRDVGRAFLNIWNVVV